MKNLDLGGLSLCKISVEKGGGRASGIECVGDLPWGAHICFIYQSGADLIEILAPYFATGLRSNEYCIWVTSESLPVGEATAALRAATPDWDVFVANGQIDVLDWRDWYKTSGAFDAERVSRMWLEKLDSALKAGFDGVRLAGDTFWLGEDEWESFVDYEARLDPIIAEKRVIAICTYAMQKSGMRELFDAVANHDFAIVKERERWTTFKSFARRRNERVLRESEARLRAIIDGACDGIITFDENAAVILANSAAARMFGYEPYELIGESVLRLAPTFLAKGQKWGLSDDLSAIFKRLIGAPRSGDGRRRDGSMFPTEWTLREVQSDYQPLFVAFARDLTEQQETESRLRKLHLDRTIAMGGMASALAHELNQPLTAMTTYLGAAQRLLQMPEEDRPASIEATLGSAVTQALRAGKIIRHIREFVARGEPDKKAERLHSLIREACELTDALAKQSNVRVSMDLGAASDLIFADRIQIKQVIVNLNRNAIESMSGSPKRELNIKSQSDEKSIQVDISDSGPGFPDDFSASFFEPHVSTKANGMGVGLSICRSIIEAHYGKIWAQPNETGGSVLSFTLPLAEGVAGT
jgi:two-component system sensor kinase FixL